MTDTAAVPTAPGSAPEPVPAAAAGLFGPLLPLAVRYAELLATAGVERGLIGPREAGRIWSRHILNCAVVAELVPAGARVVDVGSGAGLPGLAVALARPELQVTLLEPSQRRAQFLDEVVASLDLGARVQVQRGRAEDGPIRRALGGAAVVLARAVAPMDRLVRWCLPLLEPGGWLLALKGASARDELADHAAALRRAGAGHSDVTTCGRGIVEPPTSVIRVQRQLKGNDTR